ncbi:MAG TPA: ThuA domain-containing protein [Herpetosiphonaceae bacterium]
MRTLVLCDDGWHPARTARTGLAPLAESGFAFDWIEHADEWSAERMHDYRVVLLSKMNHVSAVDQRPWVDETVQAAFLSYVRRGNSVLVLHSGAAGYAEMPLLRGLMGGAFLHHPPQCRVTVEPHADHPITSSADSFTLVDEHYYMILDDEQADVCLTTRSEHGAQPGGWTRMEGDGRVCLLTPGHNVEVWLHPAYQAVIANALRWCHRADLQE